MIQPAYESENCTLYLADCLEVLPQLEAGSVDAVITDPPYGARYVSARRKHTERFAAIQGDEIMPIAWIQELKRISKFRTAVYWFTNEDGIEIAKAALRGIGFGLNTMLVWDKQAASVGNLADYGKRTEYIIFGTNGPVRLNGSRDANLVSVPRVNPRVLVHPTEKPIPLLTYLAIRSTNQDEVILDPFMGSGTTGVAAIETGRRFVGIEINEGYFNIAKARIQAAEQQLRMPLEAS